MIEDKPGGQHFAGGHHDHLLRLAMSVCKALCVAEIACTRQAMECEGTVQPAARCRSLSGTDLSRKGAVTAPRYEAPDV